MDSQLLPFLAVTSVVMLVPGPSVLYAVTQRLRSGPAAGAFAVLGLESGFAIHVGAACLGVSSLVAASDDLLRVLQVGERPAWRTSASSLLRRGDPQAGLQQPPTPPRGLARVYLSGLPSTCSTPRRCCSSSRSCPSSSTPMPGR